MATAKHAVVNLLELGTVTLSAGTAASGYPLYRLHDRDPGRLFVGSAAATTIVHVDQGASGAQAVDRLLVAAGHNLAGVTLDVEWSTNNSSWTPATAQWTGAAGLIDKSWSALTKRYWRVTATSPSAAPQIGELWLASTETWERNPDHPGGASEPVQNVTAAVTAEGRVRFEINGASLRQRNYTLTGISSAQATQLLALWDAWAGSKPFWFCDHDGIWIFMRFVSAPQVREIESGCHDASIALLEIPA